MVISILITAIVRYAGSRPELIEEEGRDEAVALAAQTSPPLLFYVVVLALAFLSPKVAAFGLPRGRARPPSLELPPSASRRSAETRWA